MRPFELVALIQAFYRERYAIYDRHVRGAQAVADYEFNNTYQYVIAREETHLRWLQDALTDLGAVPTGDAESLSLPDGKGLAREVAVIEDDARQQRAFIDRWGQALVTAPHARLGMLLRLIVNEMREHLRFFDLAIEGRDDLLGRRMPGASTGDGVLPVRWVE